MRIESSPAAISGRKTVEPRRANPLTPPFIAAIGILLTHFILLILSIPDYRVTIDSAYHVALGRAYGTHGLVTWDNINFGPQGRPNLQAPMLQSAIGALGRALGGAGDSYVLANAILAVFQWAAAMATAAWFAWRFGGATAMLFAASLLSGAAFAGGSFAAGIPSGCLFILTPWAIWFFLRRRLGMSSAATSAAIYSHLGGYLTAPAGVFIAAAVTRRWRALFVVGALTAILTAPYTIDVLRYLGWLSGVRSHSALLFDPMLDLLAIAGAARILRHPRDNPFMTAWLLAPIAWLFQDPGRFFLQWALGGSVAAALMLTDVIGRVAPTRRRVLYTAAIATIASLAPFGPPSLAAEIAWDAGMRWPRPVNWNRAHTLARELTSAGLTHYLVADYNPALCPAIAVFAPISCEKGHWVEVQPRHDSADDLSAADKVYVLPLPPDDSLLTTARESGWLQIHKGAAETSLVTLAHRPSIADAARMYARVLAADPRWLARNAINNRLGYAQWRRASSAAALASFRSRLMLQRIPAGDLELGSIIYAWALEPFDPPDARAMRRVARGFGVIASFLSDSLALDFVGNGRFGRFRRALLELSAASSSLALEPAPSPGIMHALDSVLRSMLQTRGHTFAERPPGDLLPWLG